MYHTCYKI